MSGFIDRFSKAVPAVETTYYDGLSANPHARSAVGNRNLAREKIRDGDVTGAKIFANISVKDLKKNLLQLEKFMQAWEWQQELWFWMVDVEKTPRRLLMKWRP
jgi:hypothetical protein